MTDNRRIITTPMALRRANPLTTREKQVVTLIVSGLSSREVGVKLGIAFKTVVAHRYNAMRKLKVNNVIGLMRAAMRLRLV